MWAWWGGVIFPKTAHVVPCFVFVAGRALITPQCFGSCSAVLYTITSLPFPQQAGLGQDLGRGHGQDS